MIKVDKITYLLAALGVLPFALAFFLKLSSISLLGYKPEQWLISYSVLIIAFMAGTHWGINLKGAYKRTIFIASNVLTLLAWFSALLLTPPSAVVVFIICFAALLCIDYVLLKQTYIPTSYFNLRLLITLSVNIILLAFLFF